jgi:ATP-binding cassette subfamily B protein
LRRWDLDTYYRNIAVVWGQNHFFQGTIIENCQLDSQSDGQEVREVAAALGCDEWIRSLDDGYATRIGYGGAALSSGESHKLALMRALVKNPPILLVDELSSCLDPRSEQRVLEGLEAMRPPDGITIVVTHKMDVARHPLMDRIVVLSQGHLVESSQPAAAGGIGGLMNQAQAELAGPS